VDEFLSVGPTEGGDFDFKDFYEADCATGENVSDQLAKLLTGKVNDEKLKQIKQKHLRPANAEYVQTPQVNDVIWRKMSATARAKDYVTESPLTLQHNTRTNPSRHRSITKRRFIVSTRNIGDAFKLLQWRPQHKCYRKK